MKSKILPNIYILYFTEDIIEKTILLNYYNFTLDTMKMSHFAY